ncbi:MAG: PAS domain-containing sensor histidine kinase [Legionellales bacterium]
MSTTSDTKTLHKYTTNPNDPSDPAGIHAYYQNIIHAMPNNVYWFDQNSHGLGCNDNVLKMLGLKSHEEFIGLSYEEIGALANWNPKEIASFKNDDEEVLHTGQPKLNVEEPTVYDKNGKATYYLSSRVPLKNDSGEVIGVVGISVDITADKEAEALRLKATAAEKSIQTIRLIGMSIAHELRTPLRAISSGVVGTANKLPTLLAVYKKAKEQGIEIPEGYPRLFPRDITILENVLKNIELETNAAFSVIDMLLIKGNLSKINKDKFTTCHIVTCIKNALSRYPFQSEEKKLVHCEGKDFIFHGDTLLVVHVLFNLIKNALYFVKRAGKGSIQIWLEHGKDANILHFKDTGTGIPHDILPHIFDQFFSTESNGTGIGLAFCKFVMQSMDGDIECFSVEGEYTEFVLTFPHINI